MTLDGVTETPAAVPVPLSAIVSVRLEALLEMVRLPVAPAAAVGANWICTVALWPTASVAAPLPLITENADPEIVACEMFTVSVPVFVTLMLSTAVLPVATLPKERVVALAERTPVPGSVPPVEPFEAALV